MTRTEETEMKKAVMAYPKDDRQQERSLEVKSDRSRVYRKNHRTYANKGIHFPEETLTQQEFKEECDLNNIVKKFTPNELAERIKGDPQYGQFADPNDFQESLHLIMHAEEQFAGLPATVRERFHNSAREFLAFAQDGQNAEEMATLGLMDPKAVARVVERREAKRKADFEKSVDDEIVKRKKNKNDAE